MSKKTLNIIYYVTTGLLTLGLMVGGFFEVTKEASGIELMRHLGYPEYFLYLIGVAKLLAVPALWIYKFKSLEKLKFLTEWAYAGIVIDLISAVVSILAVGDTFVMALPAFINLVITITSYTLYKKLHA